MSSNARWCETCWSDCAMQQEIRMHANEKITIMGECSSNRKDCDELIVTRYGAAAEDCNQPVTKVRLQRMGSQFSKSMNRLRIELAKEENETAACKMSFGLAVERTETVASCNGFIQNLEQELVVKIK